MARIGIDLDGVCYNFENSVREFLVECHGYQPDELPAPIGWAIDEQWGMTREEFKNYCHDGVDEGMIFGEGEPYPGTAEGFALLRDAGHTIHIVTARDYGSPGMSALNTAQWLYMHDLKYDTITYAHDKTVVATDYMIDDKIENYDDLVLAGTRAVLMDQSWNQNSIDGMVRVRAKTLREFAAMVDFYERLRSTTVVQQLTMREAARTIAARAIQEGVLQ